MPTENRLNIEQQKTLTRSDGWTVQFRQSLAHLRYPIPTGHEHKDSAFAASGTDVLDAGNDQIDVNFRHAYLRQGTNLNFVVTGKHRMTSTAAQNTQNPS